ncbi:hypothetical protein HHI36_022345 [Cryptolaemus montrouzieri]|uniref:Uncharacterized protein n=1 Tax=Cryptolaemus montrouzieri TaxID=559131 RepID=A0ABD2MZJ1_9CUCU
MRLLALDIANYVCIECLSLSIKSCADRDWKEKMLHIEEHKVICCDETEKCQMTIKKFKQQNNPKETRIKQLEDEKDYLVREFEEMENKVVKEMKIQRRKISGNCKEMAAHASR